VLRPSAMSKPDPRKRAERRLAMATAIKKARASESMDSASMEFLIVEDNGGEYHWRLLDRDGNRVARSPTFASYGATEDAACVVLAGAGSARLDPRAAADRSVAILT
jgi:uncharacterized protein YegP (UPF0339 family)